MSKIIISLLFLFTSNCFSQLYSEVDKRVINYPQFKTLNDLSIRIRNDFSSDENRVRAAFTWIAHNIEYKKTLDEVFSPHKLLIYNSEFSKNKKTRKLELVKINNAFQNKRGVCLEYSLLLNELCSKFGVLSKVIKGSLKTDIKDVRGKRLLKNHAWNAVYLMGTWKLMDVTISSGYLDVTTNRFVKKFMDYYFFQDPSDFLKNHFPANKNWQLSKKNISVESFFSAPIFFPEYFIKGVKLKKPTTGIITVSERNEFAIFFEHLPNHHEIFYQVDSSSILKKAQVKRKKGVGYFSKIKLGKHIKNNEYVTFFLKNEAILNFKIQKEYK
jgi:transglutaminase/protease-like cytokinesis protein 3